MIHKHVSLNILTPSQTSIITAFIVAITAAVAIIGPIVYKNAGFYLYFQYPELRSSTIQNEFEMATTVVNQSRFAADFAVFILWAIAGLVSYAIVVSIHNGFKNLQSFEHELAALGANRPRVVTEQLERFGIRIAAIGGVYLLYVFFMKIQLPYLIQLMRSSSDVTHLVAGGIVVIASVMMTWYVVVLLMRFIFLRTRLLQFGTS